MEGHIHMGVLYALTTFLSLIPLFALWRYLTIKNSENNLGKAMAVILG